MVKRSPIENMASGVVNDPSRIAETKVYYEALISTLNATHKNGEQDAMALLEAFSMCLGQITGGFGRAERRGALAYITDRASHYAREFSQAGNVAKFFEEAPPEKLRMTLPGIIEREERDRPKSGAGSICGAQIDALGSAQSSITFFQTPDHMGGFTAASPRQWHRLDWIVAGGESGPHARPSHPDWLRPLRDQCAAASVPFLFKQWGEWTAAGEWYSNHPVSLPLRAWSADPGWREVRSDDTDYMARVGKKAAGRLLDGVEYLAFPEVRS